MWARVPPKAAHLSVKVNCVSWSFWCLFVFNCHTPAAATCIFFQIYRFEKAQVPESDVEKAEFVEKLLRYGVSLPQYQKAFDMEDITM